MIGEPGVRRDRVAVGLVFAVHGTVTGTYASRLPWIAAHVHATPGELGAALIAPTVGALLAMPFAGAIAHRLGSRAALRLLLALWTAALSIPAAMPNVGTLAAGLFVYGAAAGTCDVMMNGQAVRIEARVGRSIMSGLHGMWSVGGIVGGFFGAACAGANVDALREFLVTAAILTLIGLFATSLLSSGAGAADGEEQIRPPRFALPAKAVLGIGLVGFCAVFAEGSGTDWSAVYLTDVTHASAAVGAYCVTGFAATMALGRLTGDRVVRRLGPMRSVRLGGVLAVLGAVAVAAARTPWLGIAGFAAMGLGIATGVPLAIAAAGRIEGQNSDTAVAGVSSITYGAGLLAGPSIGALGSAVSLSFSFGFVAVLVCGMVLSAYTLRIGRPDRATPEPAGSAA